MVPRRGYARGEAGEQRQRVHVHRDRSVGEGFLQDDADEAVRKRNDALVRDGRSLDVAEHGFATLGVQPTRAGGGVQGEPVERGAQRLVVGELVRLGWRQTKPPLRPGRRGLAGHGRGGEVGLGIVRGFLVFDPEQTFAPEVVLDAAERA
jgi:hypothetical protein